MSAISKGAIFASLAWSGVSRGALAVAEFRSSARLLLNFLSGTLDPRITFSRGTGATRVNASGFIETVGNTTPRFDYDPVTLAPHGLLIEEARTNLLLYSADFTNAAYVNSNVTVTANATAAPDGTTTADLLTAAATASVNLQQSSAVAATSATYSIFAKQGSGATQANAFRLRNTTTATTLVEITINYSTGAVTYVTGSTGAAAVNFGNGWWRITLTATTGITSGDTIRCDQCFVGASTVGHNAYVWGAQLEAGAFATSYIPTVASTVTRNADVATMTGTNFSSWYNQSEGTFVTEASSINPDTGVRRMPFLLSDAALTFQKDKISPMYDVGSFNAFALWVFGTSTAVAIRPSPSVPEPAVGATSKLAFTIKSGDTTASINGGVVGTNATAYPASGPMQILRMGNENSLDAQGNYSGHIRTIAYFNTRLPNAQLRTLTAR